MGCSNCKEKKEIKKLIYDSTGNNDGKIITFIIILSTFAIYGIVCFIKLFL